MRLASGYYLIIKPYRLTGNKIAPVNSIIEVQSGSIENQFNGSVKVNGQYIGYSIDSSDRFRQAYFKSITKEMAERLQKAESLR